MNDKNLEAAESLALINRMIENTRNRLQRNAGRPFLVWGYTTVLVSLLNYFLHIAGCHPAWGLTWFLIPVVGYLLMRLFPVRKSTDPRTEIDRMVNAVWKVAMLALIPIFVFALFHGAWYRPNLLGMIVLTMAAATATTGLAVRSKIYTVSGCTGLALSMLFPLCNRYLAATGTTGGFEIVIFAAIFIVMMVVPGHIFNYRSRRHV